MFSFPLLGIPTGLGQGYVIKYGPGPVIRQIDRNVRAMSPLGQVGGEGTDHFTLIFPPFASINFNRPQAEIFAAYPIWNEDNTWASPLTFGLFSPSHLYPRVRVSVWKRDYYASQIQVLQAALTYGHATESELIAERERVGRSQQHQQLLSEEFQTMQEKLKRTQEDFDQKKESITSLQEETSKRQSVLDEVKHQLEGWKPKVEALQALIAVVDRLGIVVFQSKHSDISEFCEHFPYDNGVFRSISSSSQSILEEAVHELNCIDVESEKGRDQIVTALIGPTGVGKSTIVNHLLKVKVERNPETRGIRVADGEVEITKIGECLTESQTYLTAIYGRDNIDYLFADCGGYFDTHGIRELGIMTSIRSILQKAKGIHLFLCFDTTQLEIEKGQRFKEVLMITLKRLLVDYRFFDRSFSLLFNKPKFDPDGILYTKQDLLQILGEFYEEANRLGDPISELYAFLLREGGRFVHYYDPLDDRSREEVYHTLNEMVPVKGGTDVISLPYSDSLRESILNEMIAVASVANRLFTDHLKLVSEIEKFQRQLIHENDALVNCEKEMASLNHLVGSNRFDFDAIASQNLDEREKEIVSGLEKIQNDRPILQQQIALLDTTDFIVYHSGGNGWQVKDGPHVLEQNKIF